MPTFPTNAALEAAIIAHPDEDTPRLVYADWLDEHGDPDRAAFIRVQCRLADMPPSDPDWVDLIEHQDELVARLKSRHSDLTPEEPEGSTSATTSSTRMRKRSAAAFRTSSTARPTARSGIATR